MDSTALEWFRCFGLVGLLGSGLLLVADLVLLYSPIPAAHFNVFTAAVGKSRARLVYGSLLGVFAIPLVLVGFAHIFLALRPAGVWLSMPPVLLGVFAYVVGAAFHAAIPFYLAAIQQTHATNASASPLVALMASVFVPLQRSLFVLVAISALWLLAALLSGSTLYPRWMAIVSPAALVVFFRVLMRISRPAVAGVLFPAGNNLAMLVFLLSSLVVLA
jgi:hypothetical protein